MNDIKEANKTIESYNERIEFVLPGQGEPYDSCGKFFFKGHLADPGSVHYLKAKHSCHRFDCPICWHDWQRREALEASDRLNYYSDMYKRKIVHYVISPPQSVEYHTYSTYRSLRKEAYKISKFRGIKGGIMIFHERACRYTDPVTYTNTHEGSHGAHFHILGDGWLSVRVKEFFVEDGWVVKNLRIRTRKGVYATLFYILDHAVRATDMGYPAISQSTPHRLSTETWFGSMAYNKFKIPKFKGSDVILCPVCKQEIPKMDWFILEWIALKDPPNEDHGIAEEGKNGFLVDRSITCWYV
jgi:hypothetical protein